LFDEFKENGVNHLTKENCNALMLYLEFACPPKVEVIHLLLSVGNEMDCFESFGENYAIHHLAMNP